MNIQSRPVATLLLVLVCAIWGIGFVVTEHALGKLTTQSLNALRFALAALSLVPLWLATRKARPRSSLEGYGALWRAGLGLGLVLFVAFYAQTEGLRFTSVSNAGFITGLCVPLVPLLAWLVFKAKMTRAIWMAVSLSTLGLYLLTGGTASAPNKGDLLVLLGAAGFATHIVLTGHYARTLPAITLSLVQMLAVSAYSLLASYLLDVDQSKTLFSTQAEHWQSLLSLDIVLAFFWMASLSTAFGFWVQTSCQRTLPAHQVALVFALEPIFAHLAGALWLGERLDGWGFAGAAAIIAGMLVAELGDRRSAQLHPADLVAAPAPPGNCDEASKT
ncbi:DMT family transporter [Simiduia sp. 21SJ11W-1]|uniref:DMT family transporter n=1 Tax=Simiduia sp. 21SJ11W-1 TaxID=2909669 RepID=UPI00209EAA12|nr:DMT family transporter [Simiduia sp. 21SJ11W-1]UTA46713.1 DMT family transporter [Simiduia sp. 21SJ11W-1]